MKTLCITDLLERVHDRLADQHSPFGTVPAELNRAARYADVDCSMLRLLEHEADSIPPVPIAAVEHTGDEKHRDWAIELCKDRRRHSCKIEVSIVDGKGDRCAAPKIVLSSPTNDLGYGQQFSPASPQGSEHHPEPCWVVTRIAQLGISEAMKHEHGSESSRGWGEDRRRPSARRRAHQHSLDNILVRQSCNRVDVSRRSGRLATQPLIVVAAACRRKGRARVCTISSSTEPPIRQTTLELPSGIAVTMRETQLAE
jgi:hypothetical protein